MSKKSLIFKYSLLVAIFVFLFSHLLFKEFNFIELPPLKGYNVSSKMPEINIKECFDGNFQQKEDDYINDAFGFRSLYVRLHNQIKFSVFKSPTANGVIIGKENYFYEENYIKAYTGVDFLGEDSINKIVNRINFISDTLTKLNKQLIIVFAAGKASFYPEFIPDNYLPVKGNTNYKALLNRIKNTRVNYIDFNQWFIQQKASSKYPLYPKYGIHWSNYGTFLAADSLIKKIEFLRKIDMPNLIYNDIELKQPFDIDYDIADGMNLLFRLKSFDMAYPKIKTGPSENKIKPSVLVISDSFYWGMYGFGIANSFTDDHFWYYNKQVYPETFKSELFVEDLNINDEIEKHDVIIVMATEATLPKIGWGFFENIENVFKGVWVPKVEKVKDITELEETRRSIRGDIKWMKQIEGKAKERKISVDSMLTLDAIWTLEHQN